MRRGRARDDAATRPFALFAECMLTGVWFTVAALPLVTLPAALAASSRHLAGFVDGTPCTLRDFGRDFRSAFVEGWRTGLAVVAAVVALALNALALSSGLVPGTPVIAPLTALIAAVALCVLLRAAAAWEPGVAWGGLLRRAAVDSRADLGGTGILLGGMLVTVVSTWALWILFVPLAGCVVGAAVAVHRRREDSFSTET